MKVFVGLSGGVDSAVAAYLLKKAGHDVTAGFMRNWDAAVNDDYLGNPTIGNDVCPQEQDYHDAKKVADLLGREHNDAASPFFRENLRQKQKKVLGRELPQRKKSKDRER